MTENVETSEIVESLPVKHQLGRLVAGSVAGFAADHLTKKAYDWTVRTIRARKSA